MSATIICWLLVVHYVADFIMQPHKLATTKGQSNAALLKHIGLYSVTLGVGAAWLCDSPLEFVAVNAAAHFTTDYATARWSGALWKQGKARPFFLVIGLDQLAHTVVLVRTLEAFGGGA